MVRELVYVCKCIWGVLCFNSARYAQVMSPMEDNIIMSDFSECKQDC